MTEREVRAQLLEQLQGIRLALEALVMVAAGPDETPASDVECPHPEESRVSFGVTNGVEDWQCVCGYRTVTE